MNSMASHPLRRPARQIVAPVVVALCCSGTLQSDSAFAVQSVERIQPSSAQSQSQGIEQALSGVVLIAGSRGEGTAVRGSGFVVALERGVAIVVTSSHVIEGTKFEVTFGADPSRSFAVPPADVIKIETQNINGLAAFRVRGAIPAQVRPLGLASGDGPGIGASLYLVGFPQMATTPRTVARVFSGRDGQRLVFDQSVGEGFSGGPVIWNDKVIGLVTDIDNQFTYGISFIVMREFLLGSGVKLAEATVPSKPAGESRGPVGGTPAGGDSLSIDRRPYTVRVSNQKFDAFISAMRAVGYTVDVPAPASGRPAEGYEVISIGARVPVRVAQELLTIARQHMPTLRYVILTEDRHPVPGVDWSMDIFMGISNRTLDEFRKATPLPPSGWQRILNAPDDDTFRKVVRAYYQR
jgi:hypothetical protein